MNKYTPQKNTMPRIVGFFLILLLFAPQIGYAQMDPCGADFNFSVTKDQLLNNGVNWRAMGSRMQSCDSLLIMSKAAFGAVVIEREYYRALSAKLDSLILKLDEGRSLRDSMIAQQQSFIDFQRGVITKYDSLLVNSNHLVTRATENTDKALTRLKLLRLTSIGGIAIGVGGLLVALAVN